MALRPLGVYLLAGTALHSQTRTARHLSRMNRLAAESASLALSANVELESSVELQSESALDSEEGFALQSRSVELELRAEREFVRAAEETAAGDEFAERAEWLHERSARDALESESSLARADEMELRSTALRLRAEGDRAAAALDEEKSLASLEGAARAEEIAAQAEEKAAGYEALAMRREGRSARDGEAFLRTEAGAAEDAEVMAACTPIPILNIVCDAVGGIIEAGYQGVAAFEGAKSAIETMAAITAQRKERVELVLAIEEQEEAARLGLQAEEFGALAEEEEAKALAEEGESEAAGAEAGEAEAFGEGKLEESEEEDALAGLDEEKAAEEYANAALDESIAVEEESAAIADQIESEELLSESAGEEFKSLAERFDGESKDVKAEKKLKQSLGHGVSAFGLVLHAVVTAALVVYVVVMKGLMKWVTPGVAKIWRGESTSLTATQVMECTAGFVMHAVVIMGTIASMPITTPPSNLEQVPAALRIRALLYLAAAAGVVESLAVHCTHAGFCCYMKGMDGKTTIATTGLEFLAKVVHLVPVVLIEVLILTVIFGPDFFQESLLSAIKSVWIWGTLLILISISTHRKMKALSSSEPMLDRLPIDEEERECLCSSSNERRGMNRDGSDVIEKEYGSMEEVSLLTDDRASNSTRGSRLSSSNGRSTSKHGMHATSCMERCRNWFCKYWERLRIPIDLLVLTLMAVLLWHCLPTLRVLHPVAKAPLQMIMSSWVAVLALIIVGFLLAIVVHFMFVH